MTQGILIISLVENVKHTLLTRCNFLFCSHILKTFPLTYPSNNAKVRWYDTKAKVKIIVMVDKLRKVIRLRRIKE